jgi:hypothetical protein
MGVRIDFANVQVTESTLHAGGSTTILVPISQHATHRSQVLHVDATAATVGAQAMTLTIPTASRDWSTFDLLTFRLAGTYDISDLIKYATSPDPKASLTLSDRAGGTRRIADATAFTTDVPSSPAFHVVDYEKKVGTEQNATLFRFETVKVPLSEFSKGGGVNLANVKELVIEFDPANQTHVMFDSFQLMKR